MCGPAVGVYASHSGGCRVARAEYLRTPLNPKPLLGLNELGCSQNHAPLLVIDHITAILRGTKMGP